MDAYDASYAPASFGLNNTGAICYLNSFLQTLAGCTSLTRAILQNADYLGQTRTGKAMLAYFRAFADDRGAKAPPAQDIAYLSAGVLSALVADLAVRRPHVRFGNGQESASEALVHILDMMEPPSLAPEEEAALIAAEVRGDGPDALPAIHSAESPITRLFLHRFRCDLHCRKCKKVVSKETDYAVNFNLFHFDRLRTQPATLEEFSKAVRLQVSATEDYKCDECFKAKKSEAAARGEDPAKVVADKTTAFRVYNLTMVPEIIFCHFNLYVGYGGVRRLRYFPDRLEFPAVDGGKLVFRLVGQIEHAGSLAGGHYWARGLRAGDRVHLLNDTGVSPTAFAPTPNTYIVAYHYTGRLPPPPATDDPVASLTEQVQNLKM